MHRRTFLRLAAAGIPICLNADDGVRRVLERLAREASIFEKAAPDLIAEETLRQKALKPIKRQFRPHIGNVEPPPAPEWQTREIFSEYGFSTLADGGIREFRKPVSVDGKRLPETSNPVEKLAASIRPGNDAAKRKLLEDFENLGLVGTVTDFGQLLLLFGGRGQQHLEIELGQQRLVGAEAADVIRYHQRGGPAAMTLWTRGKEKRENMSGEIWCRKSDAFPLKITVTSVSGEGKDATREEAEVEYVKGEIDVVVPTSVIHREYRSGGLTAENRFTYGPFRRFSSQSRLRFGAADNAK